VSVTHQNGRLLLEVGDDGVGGADVGRGTGLRGLADRLDAIEGRLYVESAPGRGTTVRATMPSA
jgi:signal transduction histidine kinase